MDIRQLTEEDYDNTLLKWWDQWGFTPPSKSNLPNNGTGGIILSINDTPVCAGFLYETNSGMAWCEFIVTNKEYKESDRPAAIVKLIESLTILAKDL